MTSIGKVEEITFAVAQRGGDLRYLEAIGDFIGVGAETWHGAAVDTGHQALQIVTVIHVADATRGQLRGGEVAVVRRDLPLTGPGSRSALRDGLQEEQDTKLIKKRLWVTWI